MTVVEATYLPPHARKKKDVDPRADDPRWQRARERALLLAEEHFVCRDASRQTIASFVHRETLRALGEPIPRLYRGWGRPMPGQVIPTLTPVLEEMIARKERRQWQRI